MSYFQVRPEYPGDNLRSTAYDRVAGLLVAMLTLVGTIVLVLLGLWAAPPQRDEVVIVYQPILVDPANDEEVPDEFETPSANELPGVPLIQTPALFATTMADAVAAVSNLKLGGGEPKDVINNLDRIPRWERWKIRYADESVEAYAKQLDYFGVELGAAGGGKTKLDYAKGFTSPTPKVREGLGPEEIRLYMTWRDKRLKQFDSTLLQRAGIAVKNRLYLQFLPAKIEEALASLEAEHAGDRPVEQVLETSFGVRATADGYEFFVKDQKYR